MAPRAWLTSFCLPYRHGRNYENPFSGLVVDAVALQIHTFVRTVRLIFFHTAMVHGGMEICWPSKCILVGTPCGFCEIYVRYTTVRSMAVWKIV